MDNISKEDINFRLDKIKNKVNEINTKIEENNQKFETRYDFAKKIGIKVDSNNTNNEVSENLNKYVKKIDKLIEKYNDDEELKYIEEYKILNNMLYLDDIKLKNIKELISENESIATKEYINMFANKANDLIRQEEIKNLDSNIAKYSKISFFEKITGKAKIKKALIENCNLKKMETINKKYIPENKSLYEIVSITNNCGYKSNEIKQFIDSIVNEFKLEKPKESALMIAQKEEKIPLFFNKEYLTKINFENADMTDRINKKSKNRMKTSEYKMFNDMLIKDVSTLELFNFNDVIDEVI